MSDVNIKVNIVSTGARRAIAGLENDAKGLDKAFKGVNVSIKNSVGALQVFAGNVAARAFTAITSSLVDAASAFIRTTRTVEDLGTQLTVLTGSSGQANALLNELTEFSARTPFRLENITESANQLLAFGFAAEDVTGKLQEIGDVAAASGQPLKEIAQIYGQVAAAGKLTGERLLQLQERAVPIGPAIAKTLGVAESQVRSLVSEGKVGFAEFEQAFASLSAEGGLAFEGIARQSQTLSGRLSTLQDNIFILQNEIGARLSPALKAAASEFTILLQNLQSSPAFKEFLKDLSESLPSAIQFIGFSIDILNITFAKLDQTFELIKVGINSFVQVTLDVIANLLSGLDNLAGALNVDLGLKGAIDDLRTFSEVSEEAAVAGFQSIADIQKQQEDFSEAIATTTGNIVNAYEKEKLAAEEAANAVISSEEAKNQAKQQLTAEQLAFEEEVRAAQKELNELIRIEEQDLAAVRQDEKLQMIARFLGEEEAIRLAAQQRKLQEEGKGNLASIQLEKKLTEAKNKELLSRKMMILGFTQAEIGATKNALGTISTLTTSSNKTLFRIGKAASLANATIKGYEAVQNAYAQVPYPYNFAAAALVGVASAAQIAKIASQQAPSFQSGGIVAGSSLTGDRVQANLNSGEMVLNRSQQSELLGIANGTRSGGGAGGQPIVVHTNVNVDGETIARAVSRQVADGFELGEVV